MNREDHCTFFSTHTYNESRDFQIFGFSGFRIDVLGHYGLD